MEPIPQVVAWEATRACRFACVHCRAEAQMERDPWELTTEEAFKLVDEIAEFSKPLFIITGGDPLLRGDVFDVVKRADERGLKVVMSPSGSHITSEVVQKMRRSGVRMVSISIDGPDRGAHDGFRKVDGAFDTAISAIRQLREGGMKFQINTTVTQHNVSQLQGIRDLTIRLGAAAWDVFMLVPTGRARVKMEISPEEYEQVLETIYRWNQTSPIPIKMTCAPHYMRLISQMESKRRKGMPQTERSVKAGDPAKGRRASLRMGGRGCMAGNGFCFISSRGEVYGCGFLPLKAGDVRVEPFRKIYQESPLFRTLRDYNSLRGRCGVCEYRVVCGGCRARALGVSKDFMGEEPYCTYRPPAFMKKTSIV